MEIVTIEKKKRLNYGNRGLKILWVVVDALCVPLRRSVTSGWITARLAVC